MKDKILHMYYGLLPNKGEIVQTLCGKSMPFTREVIAMLKDKYMCRKCMQEHRRGGCPLGEIVFPETPDEDN